MQAKMASFALAAAGLIAAGRAEGQTRSTGGARDQARSLGVGVGRVDPQGQDAALWLTANLRWGIGGHVVVEPEASYWKKSQASPAGDSRVEDLSGGVNVLYRFRSRRPLGFFAGGGVGLHLVRSSFTIPGSITVVSARSW